MNKRFKKVILGVIVTLGGLVVSAGVVMAASRITVKISSSPNSNTVSKAALEGVYQCFKGGAYSSWFLADNSVGFVLNDVSDTAVKLPYGWTSVSDNHMNCRELMFGRVSSDSSRFASGLASGMLPDYITGGAPTDDELTNRSFRERVAKYFAGNGLDGVGGIGYYAEPIMEEVKGKAQALKMYPRSSEQYNRECGAGDLVKPELKLGSANVEAIVFPTVFKKQDGTIGVRDSLAFNVPSPKSYGTVKFTSTCGGIDFEIEDVSDNSVIEYNVYSNGDFVASVRAVMTDEFGVRYEGNIDNWVATAYGDTVDEKYTMRLIGNVEKFDPDETGQIENYRIRFNNSYMGAVKGLNERNSAGVSVSSVLGNYSDLTLTRQEVFDLYRYYIQDVYKVPVVCEGDPNYASYRALGSDSVINWTTCGECRADFGSAKAETPEHVYGADGDFHFTNIMDNAKEIKDGLNALGDLSDLKINDVCSSDDSSGGGDGGGTTTPPSDVDDIIDCNKFGDVGAMQWVLCPTMNNTQRTAIALGDVTNSLLRVETTIYDKPELKNVWNIVRNIANVVVIVFFLIIIISQVTGYGIDNYGIKKMLPRLIVMAIIVNLSLYICQIAVDLSNIFGEGLNNMFASMGAYTESNSEFMKDMIGGGIVAVGAATSGAISTGVSAGSAMAAMGAVGAIPIIIGVIVATLVIIVAVFVILLMLGLRKIIVIACIALAPLAFVAYILPNTQNFFKKWWELFKAALIIYPICGAALGISGMIKTLVTKSDLRGMGLGGLAMSLLMVILPYAVFFLIPMLLKNAIAALGKIGGALTSFGNAVTSGAKSVGNAAWKTAQGTEAFKDMQQEANRRRQQSRADNIVNRLKGRTNLSDRQKRRLYDAEQTQVKMKTEQMMANEGMVVPDDNVIGVRVRSAKEAQVLKNYEDQYRNQGRSYVAAQLTNAVGAYGNDRSETNRLQLQAALNEAERRGMDKELLDSNTGFTSLGFSTGNSQDARLLDAFGGSSNVVLSQFGKQMPKYDTNSLASLNDFVDRKMKGADGTELSLMTALDSKGPDSLNGANDDILKYLGGRAASNGNNVVSANHLIHAGEATTDGKVQAELNRMLPQALAAGGVSISGKQLAGQDINNLSTLVKQATEAGDEALKAQLQSAINDINNSPELRAGLTNKQKEQFARVTGGGVPAGGGISAAAAPVQAPRVPASAPRAQSTGSKPFMTGEGLTKLSTDGLRSFANAAMNDGEGSRNYNDFMAASNELAGRVDLMSNLSSEQRQIIHGVRSRFNSNDTKFGGGPQAPNVPK